MKQADLLRKILNGSKQFRFEGAVLELQHYYSGEKIKLDLSVLLDNEDILEDMLVDDDEDEEEDY